MKEIMIFFNTVPDFYRVILLSVLIYILWNFGIIIYNEADKWEHFKKNAKFKITAVPIQFLFRFLLNNTIRLTLSYQFGMFLPAKEMKKIVLLIFVIMLSFKSFSQIKPNYITGTWVSQKKNIRIEMFEQNGRYFGKVKWFSTQPNDRPMDSYLDVENPNPKLNTRKWIGMQCVENLVFDKNNCWSGGTIYDPHSGHTFKAIVKYLDKNCLIVKGYCGFEFFGKSMVFFKEI